MIFSLYREPQRGESGIIQRISILAWRFLESIFYEFSLDRKVSDSVGTTGYSEKYFNDIPWFHSSGLITEFYTSIFYTLCVSFFFFFNDGISNYQSRHTSIQGIVSSDYKLPFIEYKWTFR